MTVSILSEDSVRSNRIQPRKKDHVKNVSILSEDSVRSNTKRKAIMSKLLGSQSSVRILFVLTRPLFICLWL